MTHPERAARRKEVAAFVEAGATVREAVEKFGLCWDVVRKACREHGIPIVGGPPSKPTTYAIIAALCATDETMGAMAKRFGISVQRVSHINVACLAAGIPVRKRLRGAPLRKIR